MVLEGAAFIYWQLWSSLYIQDTAKAVHTPAKSLLTLSLKLYDSNLKHTLQSIAFSAWFLTSVRTVRYLLFIHFIMFQLS